MRHPCSQFSVLSFQNSSRARKKDSPQSAQRSQRKALLANLHGVSCAWPKAPLGRCLGNIDLTWTSNHAFGRFALTRKHEIGIALAIPCEIASIRADGDHGQQPGPQLPCPVAVHHEIRIPPQGKSPGVCLEGRPPPRGLLNGTEGIFQFNNESLGRAQAPLSIPSHGGFSLGHCFGVKYKRLTAHCGGSPSGGSGLRSTGRRRPLSNRVP